MKLFNSHRHLFSCFFCCWRENPQQHLWSLCFVVFCLFILCFWFLQQCFFTILSWLLCMVCDRGLASILSHVAVQFPQHHVLKRLACSTVYSCCFFGGRFIVCFYVGLFLDSPFFSIGLCSSIVQFWLLWLCSRVWNLSVWLCNNSYLSEFL